jgi:hypothetical protein
MAFFPFLPTNVEDLRSRIRGGVADVTRGTLYLICEENQYLGIVVQHMETGQTVVAISI